MPEYRRALDAYTIKTHRFVDFLVVGMTTVVIGAVKKKDPDDDQNDRSD